MADRIVFEHPRGGRVNIRGLLWNQSTVGVKFWFRHFWIQHTQNRCYVPCCFNAFLIDNMSGMLSKFHLCKHVCWLFNSEGIRTGWKETRNPLFDLLLDRRIQILEPILDMIFPYLSLWVFAFAFVYADYTNKLSIEDFIFCVPNFVFSVCQYKNVCRNDWSNNSLTLGKRALVLLSKIVFAFRSHI